MTRRKLSYPLEKVTLELREGDFEHLAMLYGRQRVSATIRNLVIRHLNQVDFFYTNHHQEEE
jgi:hypothetical protein